MTYDSPLWASEEWVIPEVATFREEGLVTKKEEIEKKESWKIVAPQGNWTPVSCMICKSANHYTIQRLM